MSPIEEISRRLSFPPELATKLVVFGLQRRRTDDTPLTPAEELALAVSSWAMGVLHISADAMVLLLQELQAYFQEIAPAMQAAWTTPQDEAVVPAHELHFADNRYVTWGERKDFWDLAKSNYLNPLPQPPKWRTSVHLCALYFAYQGLKERKDADQVQHAPRPSR